MMKSLGRYIVVDAAIRHGQPTFLGTRLFVSDVLDDVSRGMPWEAIIERWHDAITTEAIAEAVRPAREALVEHTHDLVGESSVRCAVLLAAPLMA